MAVGTVTARTASTPSSAAISSRQARNASRLTAAVVSTGPATAAPGGSSVRSRRWVAVEIAATRSPLSPQASAARTPAPPALDTIAIRSPAGSGWAASMAAASISSPMPGTAMMPAWANSASWVTRGVAAAAVWEAAARWPAADRPPSTVSTGICCPTRRAVRANFRGLPNDSTYSTASLVRRSCSHQVSRSLLDTSYLSPTEANDDTPIPSSGQVLQQGDADAAGLDDQPRGARSRMSGPERRVQAEEGHRDAEAVGADQAHAVPAADGQQVRAQQVEAGGDDHEGPDAAFPALRRDLGERLAAGTAITARSTLCGKRIHRGQAGQALQGGGPRVDRVHRAGEPTGHDVPQDLPAHGSAPPARADHGHRRRVQQVPQALDIRAALTRRHGIQIPVQARAGGFGEREGQFHHAIGHPPLNRQPGIGEDPEHRRVLCQRLGRECAQPALPGDRHQVLQQERRDPLAVHVVGYGERDFGDTWLACGFVARHSDQAVTKPGEQRRVVGSWLPGRRARARCQRIAG